MKKPRVQTIQAADIGPEKQAKIAPGQFTVLQLPKGKVAQLTASDLSVSNICKIAITGAPPTGIIVQLNGQSLPSLNGFFNLPPNKPNSLRAVGNFEGLPITITNISAPQTDAVALISVTVIE